MTPQERDLIQTVIDRLAKVAGSPKDAEAEAYLTERLRPLPDAAYNLVQAVVIQELGLKQAETRIAELERQLAEARAAAPQSQPAGAGFLAGSPNPWARSSVPPVGAPPPQPQYAAPSPQYAPAPQYAAQQPTSWGQPAAGGGFLRSAATTAAGVAGGVLLAEGLSSMFSGHHGGGFGGGFAGGSPWGATPVSETVNETVVNNYYSGPPPADTAPAASYDTSVSDDGDYGGFDDAGDSDTF